jgi:hypothetical protein
MSDALEAAITRALADNHLPESYRQTVRDMLSQPEDDWPYCCGGGCDPCAMTLHAAARRARHLLEHTP